MMKKSILNASKFALVLMVGGLLFTGCGSSEENSEGTEENKKQKVDSAKATLFQVGDEFFSIPSPVQTAILIQKTGATYNGDLLNDPKKGTTYSTKFQRAINLGIYGADLGYVTMYEQTQVAITFMSSTKKIAEELGVASAFNESLMKRFEANLGNRDSLINLVSDAYRASDAFLKNNERDDVGGLILAGGWVESLYFSCEIARTSNHPDLKRRIAEQKNSLENIIKLMQRYTDNEEVADFVDRLIELYYKFDGVEQKYVFEKPETFADKKLTVINSKSEVIITDEQIQTIANEVKALRTFIVG